MSAQDTKFFQELESQLTPMDEAAPKFIGMFYGPSGVGKTVLAMRVANQILPVGKKILYVDFKEGFFTLQANKKWHSLTKDAIRIQFDAVKQLEFIGKAIATGYGSFQQIGVVVLDESSSMFDRTVSLITQGRAAKDPGKDPFEPKMPDFNVSQQMFKNAVDIIHSSGAHVIHVAHTRTDNDATNIKVTSPNFQPKLLPPLKEVMSLVGYVTADMVAGGKSLEAEEYKRWVQVQPTRTIDAKSRIDSLSAKATFDEVVSALAPFKEGNGKLTSELPIANEPDNDDLVITVEE